MTYDGHDLLTLLNSINKTWIVREGNKVGFGVGLGILLRWRRKGKKVFYWGY